MRYVVFSSTDFGRDCVEALLAQQSVDCELAAIVTTAETIQISYASSGVKISRYCDFARDPRCRDIQIFNIGEKFVTEDVVGLLKDLNIDFALVLGWYFMIPKKLRDIFPKGCAGIHASDLPKYRGGAPLVWAIINGEKEVGTSLFYLGSGVDDGDVLAKELIPVTDQDDIASLYEKVTDASITLLVKTMPAIAQGTCQPVRQVGESIPIFPQRSPDDGQIDWAWSMEQIYNFIRAQTRPYPGAFTVMGEEKIHLWQSERGELGSFGEPGEVLSGSCDTYLMVGCGDGCVKVIKWSVEEQENPAFSAGMRFK